MKYSFHLKTGRLDPRLFSQLVNNCQKKKKRNNHIFWTTLVFLENKNTEELLHIEYEGCVAHPVKFLLGALPIQIESL